MTTVETPPRKELELPSFRTAGTILEACLVDIDQGRWICGDLCRRRLTQDLKPEGCAIGLVGMNSGAAHLRYDEWRVTYPNQDRDNRWSDAAKTAIGLLAETTHKWNSHSLTNQISSKVWSVFNYNDELLPHQAREWFERALVLAKERGL